MTNKTRESYIESELKKWKEKYLIPIEQEFQLNAMLSLQYQFLQTPEDHVKTKRDLIDAIQRISNSLRLEHVMTDKPFKVLVITNRGQYKETVNMFFKMMEGNTIDHYSPTQVRTKLITSNYSVEITCLNLNSLKGKRADYILNLTGDSEIDDYFKGINKL